jgi:hypothetical protein
MWEVIAHPTMFLEKVDHLSISSHLLLYLDIQGASIYHQNIAIN